MEATDRVLGYRVLLLINSSTTLYCPDILLVFSFYLAIDGTQSCSAVKIVVATVLQVTPSSSSKNPKEDSHTSSFVT